MSARQLCRGWRGNSVVCVALLLALIGALICWSGWLVRVDYLVFDLGQRLGQRAAPPDVMIIAIDADSLARLGRWPWRRDRHARLLRTVCAATPAVVAVDIVFGQSERHVEDAALVDAVATCGRVVLPIRTEAMASDDPWRAELPIPSTPLARAAAGLGRVGVNVDEDGIVRAVNVRDDGAKAAWPLFAAEILRVATLEATQAEERTPARTTHAFMASQHGWLPDHLRRIEFIGPPGSFRAISFVDVLEGKVAPQIFAGKIVLVGVTAPGFGDALPTPVSPVNQTMSGVEIQANIVTAMREERLIKPLPSFAAVLLTAVLAITPLFWLPRLMPLPGLLASTAWVLGVTVVCAVLPMFTQHWLPPSGVLVAGLFAFPLWSWRRLEVATEHLDAELRQLQAALPPAKASQLPTTPMVKLSFEQRIASVQKAQQTMQQLQAQRNEALTFISHDLRAPLAGVVSQIEGMDDKQAHLILPPLRRALRMAQTFLWLARAEALDPARMREIELTLLIEQAADEVYAPAKAKGITLCRKLPEEPVWVTGDFDSLQRSLLNLLDNALRHAPEKTAIGVGLDQKGERSVRLWVENEGPALPVSTVESLFHRFVRGEQDQGAATGTGLGLFYVRTVAQAHGGEAGVECEQGRIRFWVSLLRAANTD